MLAPLVLLAVYAGTLELGDSSEARVRSTSGQQGAVTTAADFATTVQLRTRITDRRWELTLSYLPSLTLPDLELGLTPQLLHTATLGTAWHDRMVRVAVNADVTYGMFNSAYLTPPVSSGQLMPAGGLSPSLQLAAQPKTITLLSTRPMASVAIRADRRTSFAIDASYGFSGELDATDNKPTLPQQQTLSADAMVAYALSRRDQIVTVVHGQDVEFGSLDCSTYLLSPANSGAICSPEGQLFQVSEGVIHSFTRATHLTLNAGATLSRSRFQRSEPFRSVWFPSAGASLSHRFGTRGTSDLEISAQLAPSFDAFTGVVSNRGQVSLSLTDTLNHVFALSFTAAALQTFPTDEPLAATMLAGGAELGIRANKQVHLAVGERSAWQSEGNLSFFSTMAYFDVTVFAPTLRY